MYPPIQPFYKTHLRINDRVKIYLECSGNKNGIPVIYLHGGPGDHITPTHRRWYNPKDYCIILFDQRGCGQSKPLNDIKENNTHLLIEDMETIRTHLGIEKWVVAGGSWGSTLALLYAIHHPSKVVAMLLRGIYDLSKDDVLDQVYPEEKDKLYSLLNIKHKSEEEIKIKKTLSRKTKKRRELIHLMENDEPMFNVSKPFKTNYKDSETLTIIGNHYELNHFFVPPGVIYKHIDKIKHIPTILVEGRYDIITPMRMAYRLSKELKCELRIVKAGHSAMEKNITKELIKASKDISNYLKK
jgi:proline iminopeptidase